jgi:hypothetical protein
MGIEGIFIAIASVIVGLAVTAYLLQRRRQPPEAIHSALSDRLGVTDLIGCALVTMTREEEGLSGLVFVACLVPGLVPIGILVQLMRMDEPDSSTWVPPALLPFAVGLLFLLLYAGAVAWFLDKINDARRTTTCYMCASKSEGIVFVPVTFWSRTFMPKAPRIHGGSIAPSIPLDDACDIEYLPQGEEGFSAGPVYCLRNYGLGVSASQEWKERLEHLVENVTAHLKKEQHSKDTESPEAPHAVATDSAGEETPTLADSAERCRTGAAYESIVPESEPAPAPQVIRPTWTQIANGIGCLLFAAGAVLGFLAQAGPRFPLTDQMDRSMFMGGMLGVLIFSYLCAKRGLKHFKTVVVDDMLTELDGRDPWKRQKAAKTLLDRKWEPFDTAQKVKLLVASENYEEALSLDPMAAERMVDTLTLRGFSGGEAILQAFVRTNCQTAVSPLVGLLRRERTGVSKRQIVKTLKRLTGQDMDIDYRQWKTWLDDRDQQLPNID